jgi:hypothetical protein
MIKVSLSQFLTIYTVLAISIVAFMVYYTTQSIDVNEYMQALNITH